MGLKKYFTFGTFDNKEMDSYFTFLVLVFTWLCEAVVFPFYGSRMTDRDRICGALWLLTLVVLCCCTVVLVITSFLDIDTGYLGIVDNIFVTMLFLGVVIRGVKDYLQYKKNKDKIERLQDLQNNDK